MDVKKYSTFSDTQYIYNVGIMPTRQYKVSSSGDIKIRIFLKKKHILLTPDLDSGVRLLFVILSESHRQCFLLYTSRINAEYAALYDFFSRSKDEEG